MTENVEAVETVLIVDDEEPVRKTFREWLEGGGLDCRVLVASDAETALVQANLHTVDLAILDWNLGAGNDGLKLLEDLYLFNADVVAIMITGYAHKATPLEAMRMGVRDYFDKNQDLNRESFLRAVGRQLERIRPAKRVRQLHQSLVAFRSALEKVLPLVQSAAALNDPVPLPEAIRSLFRFLLRGTGARDGVLLVRSYDPQRQPPEICRAFDPSGTPLTSELVPFARSLAGSAVSMQRSCIMRKGELAAAGGTVELQAFERGRQSLLASALAVAPGVHVILELFDKAGGDFTEEDQRLVGAAGDFGAEILRHALAERQSKQILLEAVSAALGAGDSVALSLRPMSRPDEPAPPEVLDRLREGLRAASGSGAEAEATLRLAEAIRVLALRHGPAAVDHCVRMVENLQALLDAVTRLGT